MSNAEQLAEEFEKGELEVNLGAGKRSKAEQLEQKQAHPEGNPRKVVNYIASGEEKRKDDKKEVQSKK